MNVDLRLSIYLHSSGVTIDMCYKSRKTAVILVCACSLLLHSYEGLQKTSQYQMFRPELF